MPSSPSNLHIKDGGHAANFLHLKWLMQQAEFFRTASLL